MRQVSTLMLTSDTFGKENPDDLLRSEVLKWC